jgi:hypothetical protein
MSLAADEEGPLRVIIEILCTELHFQIEEH